MDEITKRPGPGRPHSGKKMITLRLEPEIIEHYRATGPGWLARVNDTLKRSVATRERIATKKAKTVKAKRAARAAKANEG